MRQLVTAIFLGLLLTALSMNAGASVIYRWSSISPSENFEGISGKLEITDAVWRAGSLDYDGSINSYDPFTYDPDSPVLALQFTVDGPDFDSFGPMNIDIFPRTGAVDGVGIGILDTSIHFNRDNALVTGSLSGNNGESDYGMSSNDSGSLWTIGRFGSDAPVGACHFNDPACSGATGLWSIDPSTVPVPEPHSVELLALGLGLLGFGLVRRRKYPGSNA